MATYEPHAAAAELEADAAAARVAAAKEQENLLELRDAHQIRRSERIVAALQAEAHEKEQEAARIRAQLTVVS